jgi:MFS family permease
LTNEKGFDAGTHHAVLKRSITRVFPVESFRVMMHRNVLFLSIISFQVSFVNRFYYFGTGPFLRQIGFKESSIMPAMSLGQVPEVFAMVLLGFFIKRIGIKRVLALGILMELLRFLSFAVGVPTMIVYAGICFHGIAFAFFFTSASIYLDSHCSRTSRSGTHQLFTIITSGFGSLCGSLAAGKTLDRFALADAGGINFTGFWAVPAGISLFALIVVLLLFNDKKNDAKNRI